MILGLACVIGIDASTATILSQKPRPDGRRLARGFKGQGFKGQASVGQGFKGQASVERVNKRTGILRRSLQRKSGFKGHQSQKDRHLSAMCFVSRKVRR